MQLTVFTDGGARGNPGPAAIGAVVLDEAGAKLFELSEYIGVGTNNEAEYKAVLGALRWLKTQSWQADKPGILFKLDSLLVVQQLNKHWKIKEPRLQELAQACWLELQSIGSKYAFQHIPRSQNQAADALVNAALDANQ